MGLEFVEIILSVEDAFGVSISDEEASRIITPNDAIHLISQKVQTNDDASCINQIAFHKIRKILTDKFDIPREDIHIHAHLRQLLLPKQQKIFWQQLQLLSGDKKLVGLSWSTYITIGVCIALAISSFYVGFVIGLGDWFIAGMVIFAITLCLMMPYGTRIPASYSKMGTLIRYIVSISPNSFKRNRYWSQKQIEEEVQNIVMEVLNSDKYDKNWEFVRDFGVG